MVDPAGRGGQGGCRLFGGKWRKLDGGWLREAGEEAERRRRKFASGRGCGGAASICFPRVQKARAWPEMFSADEERPGG